MSLQPTSKATTSRHGVKNTSQAISWAPSLKSSLLMAGGSPEYLLFPQQTSFSKTQQLQSGGQGTALDTGTRNRLVGDPQGGPPHRSLSLMEG